MTSRLPLVGGPLDGHDIAEQRGRYAWVSGKLVEVGAPLRRTVLVGGNASPSPRNGCALYVKAPADAPPGYLYAGHSTYYCNACGTYHGKAEAGREKRPCAFERPSA